MVSQLGLAGRMQFTKGIKNLRPFFVIFCLLLISIYLVDRSGHYTTNSNSPENSRAKLNNRFDYIMQSWPEISKNPNQTTLFIGTSVYQYFLDPRVYDEEIQKYGYAMKSYNLAFQGIIGIGLTSYIHRLRAESEKNNTKFDTAIFEIIPSAESKKFYNTHRNIIEIGNPEVFMNPTTWKKLFFTDPISALYLSFVKHVRPLAWNHLIKSVLTAKKFRPRGDKFAGITSIWSQPQFYEVPEWNILTAGMVNWNRPESDAEFEKTMEAVHKPERWNTFLKEYIAGNTVSKDFSYEENLIRFYIQAINESKKFAKHVYILKLPTTPSFQKLVDQYVDEGFMLNQVHKETGVKIIDYTRIGHFTDDDFADPMHLKQDTMNFYMRNLAKDIAEIKKSDTEIK